MSGLTDQQVDRIARELAKRWQGGVATAERTQVERPAATGAGVYGGVDSAVAAAGAAFAALSEISLEKRGEIIAAMRATMLAEAEALAVAAWRETGMGRAEDKLIKNRLVTLKTPGTEMLTPTAWTGDRGLALVEWAPFGVIGAITPTTNPTSTIICNAIAMLAAGNSVVFNVHPGARSCCLQTVDLLNQSIIAAGGPADLITAVAEPTIASAQELMRHPGVRLLVVTGGAGVVREAMSSGKRAICAGPGNPPVVVDRSADIAAAGRDIVLGASFDNNIICVDEKEVFVEEVVAGDLITALCASGAHLLKAAELSRLEKEIFDGAAQRGKPATMNKNWIGKNADEILGAVGVRCAAGTRLALAEVDADHPLVWSEQMMPVMPVVRVPDVTRGIELARQAEHGCGHSAAMHSRDIDALSAMARAMNTSIFVKNGPIYAGLAEGGEGFTSFTIASPTGEGMTGPISFSRQRRCVLVDHFRIV